MKYDRRMAADDNVTAIECFVRSYPPSTLYEVAYTIRDARIFMVIYSERRRSAW